MNNWFYWFEDWLTYDKVTFDGINKLIIINNGENDVDIHKDIYSAWVDWREIRENSKFLDAIRFTGGDPTVAGQFSGLIFFMINGWRIFFNHSVIFRGSIFSDNYSSPFSVPDGTYMGQSVVSSLVTMVSTTGGGGGTAPTAEENALATKQALQPDFGALPTANENAIAVKSSLASDFNAIPTASENAAAVSSLLSVPTAAENAAEIWNTILLTYTGDTTAGALINLIKASQDVIEQLSNELHKLQGLNAATPMTVTPTTRDAGDIHLVITGDGKTSTTVTRQ